MALITEGVVYTEAIAFGERRLIRMGNRHTFLGAGSLKLLVRLEGKLPLIITGLGGGICYNHLMLGAERLPGDLADQQYVGE